MTSKLPLASETGVPATCFATEISGMMIGVGSLPNVPSISSSPFSPVGSVPLSLSSVAVIGLPVASTNGLPFSSRAAPVEVA